MKKFRRGIASKDLIIMLLLFAIIGSLTTYYLIGAKKTFDTDNLKNDFSFTFKTMYDKVKASQRETTFNLEKVFNKSKGVYNGNRKSYSKTIAEKNINNKVSGIITYNGEATLNIGTDSIDNTLTSLNSTKINKNLKDKEIGFFIGTKENLNVSCSGYGVNSNDKVLTIFDTIQNSDGITDPTPDICRGGIEKEFINYFIFVLNSLDDIERVNKVYFGDEGQIMNLTDGTNIFYGLSIIVK